MNKPVVKALVFLLGALAHTAHGQALPDSSVWLLDITGDKPGTPLRISPETGYHNQPMFSADGRSVFFTSEQPGGQTDILRYAVAEARLHTVHQSPDSDYSPTPIPNQEAISVVRVEAPDARQRLWRIPLDGAAPGVLLPDVEPVGYHTWLDGQTVALFILGETFDLHIAVIGRPGSTRAFANIGRTLRRHPDSGEVLFVNKNIEPWAIAALNPGTGSSRNVMPLFPGIEDFEVDSEGRYWMGSGSKLYRSNLGHGWALVADLGGWGIRGITRISVHLDGRKLALCSIRSE